MARNNPRGIFSRSSRRLLGATAFACAALFTLYINLTINKGSEDRILLEIPPDYVSNDGNLSQVLSLNLPVDTKQEIAISSEKLLSGGHEVEQQVLPVSIDSPPAVQHQKIPTIDPAKPANVLSIDFHISPIADLKDVFSKFFKDSAVVHDFSLSGACGQKGTCSQGRIQIKEDLSTLYLTQQAKEDFYNAYRSENSLIRKMDAMICSHPSGMCELIMPFDRSVILWVTTRFEQGREGNADKMRGLIGNFRALAERPDTSILANNLYDVHYFNYFTGLSPIYIPSFCDYTGAKYSWNKGGSNIILMHGYRPRRNSLPASEFVADIRRLAPQFKFEFVRDVYQGHYAYEQIASHPAMLHIPYQASIMSFFEHYRMCIPLIAPSLDLLTKWHMDYRMVSERTWDMALHNKETTASVLPRHTNASAKHVFDPNDESSADAVRYWLQFSDFYAFPHVILFDSWEDLAKTLATADLKSISQKMCDFNKEELVRIAGQWGEVLRKVPNASTRPARSPDLSYTQAMDGIYGPGQWFAY